LWWELRVVVVVPSALAQGDRQHDALDSGQGRDPAIGTPSAPLPPSPALRRCVATWTTTSSRSEGARALRLTTPRRPTMVRACGMQGVITNIVASTWGSKHHQQRARACMLSCCRPHCVLVLPCCAADSGGFKQARNAEPVSERDQRHEGWSIDPWWWWWGQLAANALEEIGGENPLAMATAHAAAAQRMEQRSRQAHLQDSVCACTHACMACWPLSLKPARRVASCYPRRASGLSNASSACTEHGAAAKPRVCCGCRRVSCAVLRPSSSRARHCSWPTRFARWTSAVTYAAAPFPL
jgi:hypothetical protein